VFEINVIEIAAIEKKDCCILGNPDGRGSMTFRFTGLKKPYLFFNSVFWKSGPFSILCNYRTAASEMK
jgi:hypothetical protein